MIPPEQKGGFEFGSGCGGLIETVRRIMKKFIRVGGPQLSEQWPTTKQQFKGSGSPELDKRLSDLFDDSQF